MFSENVTSWTKKNIQNSFYRAAGEKTTDKIDID